MVLCIWIFQFLSTFCFVLFIIFCCFFLLRFSFIFIFLSCTLQSFQRSKHLVIVTRSFDSFWIFDYLGIKVSHLTDCTAAHILLYFSLLLVFCRFVEYSVFFFCWVIANVNFFYVRLSTITKDELWLCFTINDKRN